MCSALKRNRLWEKPSASLCKHCGQYCDYLVCEIGCTYECSLAISQHNCMLYNMVHNHIQSRHQFMGFPTMAPDVKPNETSQTFWSRTLENLTPQRREEVIERMKANNCQFICESIIAPIITSDLPVYPDMFHKKPKTQKASNK